MVEQGSFSSRSSMRQLDRPARRSASVVLLSSQDVVRLLGERLEQRQPRLGGCRRGRGAARAAQVLGAAQARRGRGAWRGAGAEVRRAGSKRRPPFLSSRGAASRTRSRRSSATQRKRRASSIDGHESCAAAKQAHTLPARCDGSRGVEVGEEEPSAAARRLLPLGSATASARPATPSRRQRAAPCARHREIVGARGAAGRGRPRHTRAPAQSPSAAPAAGRRRLVLALHLDAAPRVGRAEPCLPFVDVGHRGAPRRRTDSVEKSAQYSTSARTSRRRRALPHAAAPLDRTSARSHPRRWCTSRARCVLQAKHGRGDGAGCGKRTRPRARPRRLRRRHAAVRRRSCASTARRRNASPVGRRAPRALLRKARAARG